jgi:hypothetical protein
MSSIFEAEIGNFSFISFPLISAQASALIVMSIKKVACKVLEH